MSTTIEVYPTTDALPLVESTRARAQELFHGLLNRHDIRTTITVRALMLDAGRATDPSPPGLRWRAGLEVGFAYDLDGVWDSTSWPCCQLVEDYHRIEQEDAKTYGPEFVGRRWASWELRDRVVHSVLQRIDAVGHLFCEYRNLGGPAVASTGYGLVAATLAEQTDGILASWDSAFGPEHNGETAEQFLAWWGDRQIGFYGPDAFTNDATMRRNELIRRASEDKSIGSDS